MALAQFNREYEELGRQLAEQKKHGEELQGQVVALREGLDASEGRLKETASALQHQEELFNGQFRKYESLTAEFEKIKAAHEALELEHGKLKVNAVSWEQNYSQVSSKLLS